MKPSVTPIGEIPDDGVFSDEAGHPTANPNMIPAPNDRQQTMTKTKIL